MSRRSPRKNQRKKDPLAGCGCPECSTRKAAKKALAVAIQQVKQAPPTTPTAPIPVKLVGVSWSPYPYGRSHNV
jgi:hypothetical protein